MKYICDYLVKVPKLVQVGPLLSINPDFFTVFEYEPRHEVLTVDEIEALWKRGAQIMLIVPETPVRVVTR